MKLDLRLSLRKARAPLALALSALALLLLPLTPARAQSWMLDPAQSTQETKVTGTMPGYYGSNVVVDDDWFDLNDQAMQSFDVGAGQAAHLTGTLTQSSVYVWASGTDGNGSPIPASNPPPKAYFRLVGNASAGIAIGPFWDAPDAIPADEFIAAASCFHYTADDGLDDAMIPNGLLSDYSDYQGQSSFGTHYVQKDGSSGTVTLNFTVSAHCDGTLPNPSLGVNGGIGAFPVDVQQVDTLGLSAENINKDDPLNTTYGAGAGVVYGGSIPSTSDELRLDARDVPEVPGSTYDWSTDGDAAGAISSGPPSSAVWETGPLHAVPGMLKVMCLVMHPDGSEVPKEADFEVGIRTDDCVLVGWINPDKVTLDTTGVSEQMSNELPVLGPSDPIWTPLLALNRLICLSENDDHYDQNLYMAPYTIDLSAPILTDADRKYALNWMFKYAANPDPATVLPSLITSTQTFTNTTDFTDSNGVMDYAKYQAYVANAENYKLVNHFQTKYRVNKATNQFKDTPIVLHSDTLLGGTINPIGFPPGALIPTQSGPANGQVLTNGGNNRISLVNDGSPDALAICAFNTLEAMDVSSPKFWEDIGSKITFNCGDTTPAPIRQPYPSYSRYDNGVFKQRYEQEGEPGNVFVSNPYPFGDVTTYGAYPYPSLPAGRYGIAGLPADASAEVPQFIVP